MIVWCHQRESNLRLSITNTLLYHLTMAAFVLTYDQSMIPCVPVSDVTVSPLVIAGQVATYVGHERGCLEVGGEYVTEDISFVCVGPL